MLKPLSKESIGLDYRADLSTQDYSKKIPIEGVQIINLNMFVDDGGSLAEIVRFDDNGNLVLQLADGSNKAIATGDVFFNC